MKQETTPFKIHLFVCCNDRNDPSKASCGPSGGVLIQPALKKAIQEAGLKPQVRVSTSKCLGPCGKGPVVMLYPHKIQFSKVTVDDVPAILDEVNRLLGLED